MIDPILEYKYVLLLGAGTLNGFKKVRDCVYNFRCPICGDSTHKISKKRGYLIKKEEHYLFYCHNCGTTLSFDKFLYEVNNELYKQYQRDKFSNKILTNKPVEEDISIFKNVKKFEINYKNLISVSDLHYNHKAYQYLCNRNIPKHVFSRIKWTDDFPKLIEKTIGSKYNNTILPKCGIVFELKELDGKITGYQIRNIEKNISKSQRFVICSINDEHGYYFDTINYDKPIFIVEGCIDSLFLENSISTLSSTLWKLHPSENCIYFNDQEPRNSSVCKQIDKCIKYGYNVVILPKEYENMDINDIVNSGVSYKELPDLFQKYTYSGLKAKIKFAEWKK